MFARNHVQIGPFGSFWLAYDEKSLISFNPVLMRGRNRCCKIRVTICQPKNKF